MVADFLDLEDKIGRRFREDSVTDILIASLLKVAGAGVTVLVPPETRTGGDFDILIVEPSSGDAIQYRIQAKRLTPHATHWTWGSYRELDHPHGRGGQSSRLVRSAAHEMIATIPLYAFYNPHSACKASGGLITGVELADGREVNRIVKTLVRARKASKRPRLKRVEYLRGLFFPLSTILCPPTEPGSSIATTVISPRMSKAAVEAAITRTRPEWRWWESIPKVRGAVSSPRRALEEPSREPRAGFTSPPSPLTVRQYPAIIERVIARTPDEDAIWIAPVKRPKIVLISRGEG